MNAKETSDVILSRVKNFNLNFSIQESPFSVLINIRKTFIKSKNGEPLPPNSDNFIEVDTLKAKCDDLTEENFTLKTIVRQFEDDRDETNKVAHELSIKLEKAKKELNESMFEKNEIDKEKKMIERNLNETEAKR